MDNETYIAEMRRLDIAQREEAIRGACWSRWRNAILAGFVVIAGRDEIEESVRAFLGL